SGRAWRVLAAGALLVVLAVGAAAAGLIWRGQMSRPLPPLSPMAQADAGEAVLQRERGAYLARAANCIGCHSRADQPVMAGGRPLATPFGTVTPGNLTPDAQAGLGAWRLEDFQRALHQGISRDGRLLTPAFPYAHFSAMQPEDVRDLYVWLRSLPATAVPAEPGTLRWPANQAWAVALWRGLYFSPAVPLPAAQVAPGAAMRGAYLGQTLGHCGACHDSRNSLGAPRAGGTWAGETMPGLPWWAPSLRREDQGGVQTWPQAEVEALLRTGRSAHGRAAGPMAEVVAQSTQYLSDGDLQALAGWLRGLPVDAVPSRPAAVQEPAAALAMRGEVLSPGARLYQQHCADCHGEQGEGDGPRYPALAGNRLLAMAPANNLVRSVIEGGFGASTTSQPRPHGMPPYGALLTDEELAAVISHLRQTWGGAEPVDAVLVDRLRGGVR
ncbi:c-type cytochrome, partial [Ideonella sp.]|uniref:c-type cytochrome n=1 Tax=Ideonella sp. TaxID=1929293 RepID=UPI003BB613D6